MPAQRRKLRKREVAFAVTMGVVAAGGASLVLMDMNSGPAPSAVSGRAQTFDLAPFERIESIGPHRVIVSVGGEQAIRAEGPDEALGQIEVVVIDGQLVIRPRDDLGWRPDWSELDSATFFVTVPQLSAVSVTGSGNMSIDRVDGERFSGAIHGSGELGIENVRVDSAEFAINGSGDLVASGNAGASSVTIAGSGEVRAGNLRSQSATVSITGSGDVELAVDEAAQVSIVGSGDVEIAGQARCTVTRMGSGDVRCNGADVD